MSLRPVMMLYVVESGVVLVLESIGVFVYGISGGLAAVRRRFDVVGVLVLAWATALGGGMLRDVLIGAIPPIAISNWRLSALALFGGLLTVFFHPELQRIRRTVLIFDAMGLGLFVVAGTMKALERGINPLGAAIVGVITAVGGGVIRDLLSSEVPMIMHRREEIYALPAIGGAIVTAILWEFDVAGPVTLTLTALSVIAIRLIAVRWHWVAPDPMQARAHRRRKES